MKPIDLSRPLSASRTDASSSMTEISVLPDGVLSDTAASGVQFETATGEACNAVASARDHPKMDQGNRYSYYTLVYPAHPAVTAAAKPIPLLLDGVPHKPVYTKVYGTPSFRPIRPSQRPILPNLMRA
jgi:hypothetical protein